jgi:hypothetical protein
LGTLKLHCPRVGGHAATVTPHAGTQVVTHPPTHRVSAIHEVAHCRVDWAIGLQDLHWVAAEGASTRGGRQG